MGVFKDILHELRTTNALLETIRENTLKTRIELDDLRRLYRMEKSTPRPAEPPKADADKLTEGINNILGYTSTRRKEDD